MLSKWRGVKADRAPGEVETLKQVEQTSRTQAEDIGIPRSRDSGSLALAQPKMAPTRHAIGAFVTLYLLL
jgi:hypothetical protein